MKADTDVIVIGGGFFGMYIAEFYAQQGKKVILFEKEQDFMQHASFANQARVHNGYHYPRSILTALRSRVSFPRFVDEFKDCIDNSFEKYYMIGRLLSNVTAKQFELFCQRIGVPCTLASRKITSLVNPNLIEATFSTVEYAFDAVKLKLAMLDRLEHAGVDYRLGVCVNKITQAGTNLTVETLSVANDSENESFSANQVLNCTYSMINDVLTKSQLEPVALKHEMTEMCLVEAPDELKDKGITVMCGPFFSIMPFPSERLHSFSHVRYTPHFQWIDSKDSPYINGHNYSSNIEKKSNWNRMLLDAKRYMPILDQCQYKKSIWEVKTVLPRSESNDARPILFKPNHGLLGLHSVMGGKIDNVYDITLELSKHEKYLTSI
ncbi:MAG: FAD-binding oxidoreductase [Gammaproteobacteria bacterium]|nr:FAD-binding oxidoreductase [Gammaproteobacteria bacterium]